VPRKVFVAGEILTASDVNVNLMDQAVQVFDDSAARGSAIPSPIQGMVTYLKDSDTVEVYDGAAFNRFGGKILQVVSGSTTTQVSSTSATYASTTLSASITPTLSTSKIFILTAQTFNGGVENNTSSVTGSRLLRDSTVLITNGRVYSFNTSGQGDSTNTHVFGFLDQPETTSAITYSTEFARLSGSRTMTVNASGSPATITLMEVAA
jgi:hypothetical protein